MKLDSLSEETKSLTESIKNFYPYTLIYPTVVDLQKDVPPPLLNVQLLSQEMSKIKFRSCLIYTFPKEITLAKDSTLVVLGGDVVITGKKIFDGTLMTNTTKETKFALNIPSNGFVLQFSPDVLEGNSREEQYWALLHNYKSWMTLDNHLSNMKVCAKFGEIDPKKADISLGKFVDLQLLRDVSSMTNCCFPWVMRFWSPKPSGRLDQLAMIVNEVGGLDPVVRWGRGTRPGFYKETPYTVEWYSEYGNYSTAEVIEKLQQPITECKNVTIQIEMQFRGSIVAEAHASLLILNPTDKKAYIFDPNGNHRLFLLYAPAELDTLVDELGLELVYMATPAYNLPIPVTWWQMTRLSDPYLAYVYLKGARKKCMKTLASRGYCQWICFYVTMEILSGKDLFQVLEDLEKMSHRQWYAMIETFISYLITLFTFAPDDEEDPDL